MADVASSVDDAPDDDNGDESEPDWARAVMSHLASAPAPPCPSGTPALADAVVRNIHDSDHIAEILCIGPDEVLEVQDLLEDEQDVIAGEAQTEPPEEASTVRAYMLVAQAAPLEVCTEEAARSICRARRQCRQSR